MYQKLFILLAQKLLSTIKVRGSNLCRANSVIKVFTNDKWIDIWLWYLIFNFPIILWSFEIFLIFPKSFRTFLAASIFQFTTNNHAFFHLLWKENLLNHQKISKFYEHDCRSIHVVFIFTFIFIMINRVISWIKKFSLRVLFSISLIFCQFQ